MPTGPLNWELCRSFLAVLREGNLSRAARALELTQPTLGRHIDELEAALGVALFTRSPQGLTPTDAAYDLKPHAQAMATAADALVRAASGNAEEARGVIRITTAEFIGVEILPPILTAFRDAHPGVSIELSVTNVTENLLQREADIGIRAVRPTQTGLVAKQIGEARFGLYAHRDYLKRNGVPKSMEDLRGHTLVGFDRGASAIQALREIPNPVSRDAFALRSDSAMTQFAFVRAGFGIGRGPDIVLSHYPELVPLLADQYCVKVGLWVAMHEDARANRRMRLMFDHLAKSLTEYAAKANKRKKSG